MAHLYFNENLEPNDFRSGNNVEVVGEEARHAVRVSRLRVGEHTLIGNTKGWIASGEVVTVDNDRFIMRVDQSRYDEPPTIKLGLVQALAKGDRDERAVEQSTEFGVDSIIPWQAERSISRWDEVKIKKGLVKWKKIAREASKQSLRSRTPQIFDACTLEVLITRASVNRAKLLVLHPLAETAISEWTAAVASVAQTHDELWVVVGPEGGFTDSEIQTLVVSGAHVLKLGETVLRTSSAGPAALAVLNVALGRW